MSGHAYPYDATASNPACLVTNEVHPLINYFNPWNAIIPNYAPFYRKDLVVRHIETNRVLLEGLDYYLGHRFEEATHMTKLPIYGSIMLLDNALAGKVRFDQYRTLGGSYNVPRTEIDTYLAGEFGDPRNQDWADVMRYAVPVPVVSAPEHINEAIAEDVIVGRIKDIELRLRELIEAERDQYAMVLTEFAAMGDRLVDEDIRWHHLDSEAHDLTPARVGALVFQGTAVNALKAYGLTLSQLISTIVQLGVTDAELSHLYAKTGGVLEGRPQLKVENFLLRNNAGTVVINLTSGTFNLLAEGNVVINTTLTSGDRPLGLRSGFNELTLHRVAAPGETDIPAIYNAAYLIHTDNVGRYMPAPSADDNQIYTANTPTVTLFGLGTTASPLSGTVAIPVATTTVAGIHRVVSDIENTQGSTAAAINLVRTQWSRIAGLLDASSTVNGRPLASSLVLGKSDIGLGRVDNTAAATKPASTAFKAAAANKAAPSHTHTLATVDDIPYASETTHGLTKLGVVKSERTDVAATPKLLNDLVTTLTAAENEITDTIPGNVFGIKQFGGQGYLPVPVVGAYPAAGINNTARRAVGLKEANGTWVFLRNGKDIFDEGVFYYYLKVREDGAIEKNVTTTAPYLPTFLPPGVKPRFVRNGTRSVFLFKGTDGQHYVVLTSNTMDGRYHRGARVEGMDDNAGFHTTPVLHGAYVYFIDSRHDNNGLRFQVKRALIADVVESEAINPQVIALNGANAYGTPQVELEWWYVAGAVSTNVVDEPIVLREDAGFYHSVLASRGGHHFEVAQRNGQVRVFVPVHGIAEGPGISRAFNYPISVMIDLDARQVLIDNPTVVPTIVAEAGITVKQSHVGTALPQQYGLHHISAFYDGPEIVSVNLYALGTPAISVSKPTNGLTDPFDYLDADRRSVTTLASVAFEGARGSVANNTPRQPVWFDNNYFALLQVGPDWLLAKYGDITTYDNGKRGFLPTDDRTLIPSTDVQQYMRVPRIHRANGTSYSAGGVFYNSDAQAAIVTGMTASNPLQVPTAIWNDIEGSLANLHSTAMSSAEYISSHITLCWFGDHRLTGAENSGLVILQLRRWRDSTRKYADVDTIVHPASVAASNGIVTAVSLAGEIGRSTANNVGSMSGFVHYGQPHRAVLADGSILYTLCSGYRMVIPNADGIRSMAVILNAQTSQYEVMFRHIRTYNGAGFQYHPQLGLVELDGYTDYESLIAKVYGNTATAIAGGISEEFILHSTRVASGWLIYFTEDMVYYFNGNAYTLPSQSIDLRTVGLPAGYANKTLYLYVTVIDAEELGQVATYEVRDTFTNDLDNELFIGTVTTSSTKIEQLNINPATRLGEIYELERHIEETPGHALYQTWDKSLFGLSEIINQPLRHDVSLPTFQEVFNTWLRFSHNTSGTYPANESETQAWTYNAATDTITCTVNSTTYIGFVSPQPVGDFVFDTIVGANNTDDDAIGMVLCYREVGGIQHTLSLIRTRGGIGNRFAVYYNWGQASATTIVQAEGQTGSIGGWAGLYSRMRAVREGTSFVVQATDFVASTDPSDFPSSDFILEMAFDLNDHPELAVFANGGQFGYSSRSQQTAEYINILRADERIEGSYASAAAVKLAEDGLAASVKFTSGLVADGASIPVPAGFTAAQCHVVFGYYSPPAGWSTVVNRKVQVSPSTLAVTITNYDKTQSYRGGVAKYFLVARK